MPLTDRHGATTPGPHGRRQTSSRPGGLLNDIAEAAACFANGQARRRCSVLLTAASLR